MRSLGGLNLLEHTCVSNWIVSPKFKVKQTQSHWNHPRECTQCPQHNFGFTTLLAEWQWTNDKLTGNSDDLIGMVKSPMTLSMVVGNLQRSGIKLGWITWCIHPGSPWKVTGPQKESGLPPLCFRWYCWWKKSANHLGCIRFVNHGLLTISTGAGFLPSTVCYTSGRVRALHLRACLGANRKKRHCKFQIPTMQIRIHMLFGNTQNTNNSKQLIRTLALPNMCHCASHDIP